MRIIITAGPSYEPIDQVRHISNFSTGELGTRLAEGFAAAGHRVSCFRGSLSTFASPLWGVEVIHFTTNGDLESKLERLSGRQDVNFVFHAAALCDFQMAGLRNGEGGPITPQKASSRAGRLQITLEPAPKLIARLRRMFPASILIGWKYELDGTRSEAVQKGRKQIDEHLTDACIINGQAYGSGFGVLSRAGEQAHLPDKASLCRFLIEWADRMPISGATPRPETFHALSDFIPQAPFI